MRESAARKRIIDTATRLFHGQGYNMTGINQIIDEAHIAKRSLYKHFESKTDLLMAYLDVFQDNWYATIEPYLASFPDTNDKILALFEFRIFYQEKYLFPGCPFIKINAEIGFDNEQINLRVQAGKDFFRKFILNMVKAADHKKMIGDEDLADLVFLLMEGSLSSAAIYKSSADLKKAKQLVKTFL